MKKIYKYFVAAAIFTGMVSCEDEQDLMFVNPVGSFEITSPESGAAVVLTAETATNTALTVTWQDMDYTSPTEVSYVLQISADEAFTAPVSAATTTGNIATVTTLALNNIATNAGIAPETQGTLYIRVRSTVGTQEAMEAFSNVITYIVTPYQASVPLQDLFLVGDALESGWNNNNNNIPMFRDAEDQNLYHFTGYFSAGAFKLLTAKGNWHPQYGTTGDGTLGVSGADGSNEAGNIAIATAGYYTVVVNTQDMTYSVTAFDASAAATYATMGVIGTATPGQWDSDTDMTATAVNPHLWQIAAFEATDGELKFREGNAWTNSWGDDTFPAGQGANANDPNIPMAAGTYDIWFNDLDGRYIILQ
jgi:starch-binding outer membrane protein SusE/F